jgi:sugar/nucleoside kinase (ribokinase family)
VDARPPAEVTLDPATVAAFDVVGIGNALVDVISHRGDEFLAAEGLVKGSMTLIDTDRAMALHQAMGAGVQLSGGSAANTITGVASFGGRAAYVGKVADDDLGTMYGHDLRAVGVAFAQGRRRRDAARATAAPARDEAEALGTGRCLIVVTPDAERTMNTYLGRSALLGPDDVDRDVVGAATVVYFEGYLFDRAPAKDAYFLAARVAHERGRRVALSLSDSFCVDRHRDDFLRLIAGEVDVLFGNRDELLSLYRTDDVDDAIAQVRGHCELAAVTMGAEGSLVVSADDVLHVPVEPVAHVVDTTGAGDLYAAGFLYGLSQGAPLAECGRLGSVAAAEVISHVGARPLVSLRKLAGLD